MGSPKSKPTATRPKARPTVSASMCLFDAFNHPLAYSLGLHLLAPDSIIDYARPEFKACVMSALPVLHYVKRNINLHDLNVEARVFYGGINRIMEQLHTIPQEWYDLCVDKDIYPSDAASLIKVIPPIRTKISLSPGDHCPLGRTFANYDQSDPTPAQIRTFLSYLPTIPPRSPSPSPEPEPEPGPVASSSRLIAHSAVPAGPSKKRPHESEDPNPVASDAGAPSEDEAPASEPKSSRARRTKKAKTDEGSPEPARPSKRKKSKGKAKEEAASNKIPDAPHRRNRSPGAKAASRTDKDPDATKISKLIAAHAQQAKDAKAGTPIQLNVDLDGNNYNLGNPDDIYLYLVRKKAQLVPNRFFTGYPTTTVHRRLDSDTYVNRFESLELIDIQKILKVDIKDTLIPKNRACSVFSTALRFRYCCHTVTMSELSKFHVEFAERFAVASHTTGIIVDQFQRTATRLASITSLYNDASIDFAEAFDHLVRHFNSCVEKFGDEAFASRFSDSSLAVRNHLADLVAQFRGTYKSFKNLDMSNVDFGRPPRPLSTARALIDIARDPSESVKAVEVDFDGEEEVESEEAEGEVEESRPATPPKPAPKPSSRPSATKPSSTPKKPASKPLPVRPPSTRSCAAPKGQE
ncbi:hypothetical protein DFH07DRAFT_974279 [Mycena maculata]|uniref:Uncharacterized protein n=1 Tax=Mycena maculata TaxID=230809 RepID=A0AAD7MFD0_9AGAR|nr:hypothetical protein DFH07DRAFT_974279 [Mycena maculata]